MKTGLSEIIAPIVDDLKVFQQEFENALRSEIRLVNSMARYIITRRGKHIRPILTILSSRLCGNANLNSFKAAVLVEILHIATLVHDDVVDDANMRRGWPSIKRVFNNKKAVLIGDYLLAKALMNMIQLKDFNALELLSTTAERLSSGEILQLEKALFGGMTEELYYRMVRDKTASLFSAACELGAITVTKETTKWHALREFGNNLGIAFQIKDDLFDIMGKQMTIGKPVAFDVKKNLRTLPLIYSLKQVEPHERRIYLRDLKVNARRKEMGKIRATIEEKGGIDYAQDRIDHFSQAAIRSLELFPSSDIKSSLINLVQYNTQRTR